MTKFPKRGEVWLVNWNPGRGSEQVGKRPALIIQNDIGNEKSSTTIVAAISSTVRIYPMNVAIKPPEGGLITPSIIKTSQILTVAKERLEKRLGMLSEVSMKAVDRAIKLSLAL
ncbi:MAG TPA: type II toxin-antitoxin system PemK/MazF family toxin [Thermodesulfobacteriota bacterium]|nr:type II toxin-antitoxin system PemK/MazF family toxin [Deltaproteobacteria bacterium]HNR12243.1 type II toxin-antitoxin system PemK/MazF family toxin [Thermodesulfobacteriota bacterium]HNU70085.1 type II toxin-antitoxin system PemK/MazF family toxin [Thermodesulfobacteriota bacterium]HQO78348.1 type II toxin-antitoxin system PemK/MazF family toxin [Thermodesulfobacteriota bacterium]